jgi:hypothetical protein
MVTAQKPERRDKVARACHRFAPPDAGGESGEPYPFDLRDPEPLEGTSC